MSSLPGLCRVRARVAQHGFPSQIPRGRLLRVERGTMSSEVLGRVVVRRLEAGWVAEDADGAIIAAGSSKPAVVKRTAALLRDRVEPTTLRIENVHGKLDEQRTYPRGAAGRRYRH